MFPAGQTSSGKVYKRGQQFPSHSEELLQEILASKVRHLHANQGSLLLTVRTWPVNPFQYPNEADRKPVSQSHKKQQRLF